MQTGPVTVNAPAGVIQGFADSGARKFLGIRYAQPPTGGARFRPPKPRPPSADPIDATSFGNPNYQAGVLDIPEIKPFISQLEQSEDCLFLNVYAPQGSGAKKPVMVWIHGGAFTSGSGDVYDAAGLVRENDVVVVTLNYRLGIFGFVDFRSGGDGFADSVNLGIQDQVCALAWVRENISAFGGDPDNVTIWGESAGGTSVMALLGVPAAQGLFHKVIALSGAEVLAPPLSPFDALKLHFKTESDADCMSRLMDLSAGELSDLQTRLQLFATATLDGAVIALPSCEAIESGMASGIPVIAGTVRDEGTLLAPAYAISDDITHIVIAGLSAAIGRDTGEGYGAYLERSHKNASPEDRLCRAWFDLFRSSALRVAATATQHGAGGWVYDFEVETDHALGATHFSDVPFAFDWLNDEEPCTFVHPASADNLRLSAAWSRTMTAFAKTANPNGAGLPEWPRYGSEPLQCLRLHRQPEVVSNPDGDIIKIYRVPAS
ncbi:MAG: carboxylesterase/lipase family protein [Gammaproteobacteria bacterium AqS3]|nr:carboxylesterase/lipase family protein [Gammaproteobacteria bacterium AqS3]